MKVFISWSGERSKLIARELGKFLHRVIHRVTPWLSESIETGERWGAEIARELDETDFVIICVTPENRSAPWIHFEAGAAARRIGHARVCPYLFHLGAREVVGPLAQFQAANADKEDTRKLLRDINKAIGNPDLSQEDLDRVFDSMWPDLEGSFKRIARDKAKKGLRPEEKRSQEDVLNEILTKVRILQAKAPPCPLEKIYGAWSQDEGEGVTGRKDPEFIPGGFLGVQERSIRIESDANVGSECERIAALGHLPSHMRMNALTREVGRDLYKGWHPQRLIPKYVDLINRRALALRAFIEQGGVVREIYEKRALREYVGSGLTPFDRNLDPVKEIEERLNTLLFYLRERDNYDVSFTDDTMGVPHFLLKTGVGLVVDFRPVGPVPHFTAHLSGLYTEAKEALYAFEQKFEGVWRQAYADRGAKISFVRGLLANCAKTKTKPRSPRKHARCR